MIFFWLVILFVESSHIYVIYILHQCSCVVCIWLVNHGISAWSIVLVFHGIVQLYFSYFSCFNYVPLQVLSMAGCLIVKLYQTPSRLSIEGVGVTADLKLIKMGLFTVAIGIVSLFSMVSNVNGIGANWGTQATHPLPPETVVRLLKENGIQKVKLFDADYDTLRALGKSQIEVMVGIPNDMLASLANSMKAAEKWVSKNVSTHLTTNSVNIRSALRFFFFSFNFVG